MSADFTNFSVPPTVGFSQDLESKERVEEYFEYDHEDNHVSTTESFTSFDCSFEYQENIRDEKSDEMEVKHNIRKSMSMSNIHELQKILEDDVEESTSSLSRINKNKFFCDSQLKGKMSKLYINKEFSKKYVSSAELISKFWTATPERFRSHPNVNSTISRTVTVPKTPKLNTKNRARPVTALSKDQIEELAIAEAKQHQIKAHPINQKILKHPIVPIPLQKKAPTEIKPFNLTKMHMKKIGAPIEVNVIPFQARRVPKTVYEKPKELRAVPFRAAPKLFKSEVTQVNKPAPKLTKTQPEPFSFDHRDQLLPKKRKQLVQRVMEEERKAREFHARPVPKKVLTNEHKGSMPSIKSTKSDDSTDSMNIKPFKAAMPKVLYQEPFKPKPAERPLVEITDFRLNTEVRSTERAEYERKLKEKEERSNLLREEKKIKDMEKDKAEIARLRKEMEHKANPIRRYKEVHTVSPAKLTSPMTPNFKSIRSQQNRI